MNAASPYDKRQHAREITCAALCVVCIAAMAWMAWNPSELRKMLAGMADYVWRTIQ